MAGVFAISEPNLELGTSRDNLGWLSPNPGWLRVVDVELTLTVASHLVGSDRLISLFTETPPPLSYSEAD